MIARDVALKWSLSSASRLTKFASALTTTSRIPITVRTRARMIRVFDGPCEAFLGGGAVVSLIGVSPFVGNARRLIRREHRMLCVSAS